MLARLSARFRARKRAWCAATSRARRPGASAAALGFRRSDFSSRLLNSTLEKERASTGPMTTEREMRRLPSYEHESSRGRADGAPVANSHRTRAWFRFACVAGWVLCVPDGAAQDTEPPAYRVRFVDGTTRYGTQLTEGHRSLDELELDGVPLVGGPSLRSIERLGDAEDRPSLGWLEFEGGDRLPGEVVAAEPTEPGRPTSLVVRAGVPLGPPRDPIEFHLRVRADFVRRVVWNPYSESSKVDAPGLRFRDGRWEPIRSVRFEEDSVVALTEDRVLRAPYTSLSSLSLPARDPWEGVLDALALLSPNLDGRLMRLETTDGLVVTASDSRLRPTHYQGNGQRPSTWLEHVHAPWSLDPIWIRFPQVKRWAFFDALELPLSRIPPVETERRPIVSVGWLPRVDRNVRGTNLETRDAWGAWGVGVHAPTTLVYPLHEVVSGFRSLTGIDREAIGGGAARALVAFERDGRRVEVFRSDLLTGASGVVDTGALDATDATRLVLEADPATEVQGDGIDPWDIRDLLDWLEPVLWLDETVARREVRERLHRIDRAFCGWAMSHRGGDPLRLRTSWYGMDSRHTTSRTEWQPAVRFVRFTKSWTVTPEDRFLLLRLHRRGGAGRVTVLGDGQHLGSFTVPTPREEGGADAVIVPFETANRTEVELSVDVESVGSDAWFSWPQARWYRDRPGIRRLFSEEPNFALRPIGDGHVELDPVERLDGAWGLRVEGRVAAPMMLDPPLRIRVRPQWGEYRYITFAWRVDAGSRLSLEFAQDGEFSPRDGDVDKRDSRRYETGRSSQSSNSTGGSSTEADSRWSIVTKDLVSDFGRFDLSGLALDVVGGGAGAVDRIFLTRTRAELGRLPLRGVLRPDVPVSRRAPAGSESPANREQRHALLASIAPGFAFTSDPERVHWRKATRGRTGVLETTTRRSQPVILSGRIRIPERGTTILAFELANGGTSEWQHSVRFDGEVIESRAVSGRSDNWMEVLVDLSGWAGREGALDLVQEVSRDGRRGTSALWRDIEVVTSTPRDP